MVGRIIIFAIFYLLPVGCVKGQCPDRGMVWKRLNYLKDSPVDVPTGVKLKELLQFESALQNCRYTKDSVFAFLLEQIATYYDSTGEFVKSIEYERRSIQVIRANAGSPAINRSRLVRSYYKLADFYGNLNLVSERFRAMDTCIFIGLEYRPVSKVTLYVLYLRADYSYKMGDYPRALDLSEMGAIHTRNYLHDSDSASYSSKFLSMAGTCEIYLGHYDEAEKEIALKLKKDSRVGATGDIGTTYDQLGMLQIQKREYEKAFSSFELAAKYCEAAGYYRGCQQALTNLGYYLYEKKRDGKASIAASVKAVQCLYKNNSLTKADSIECLNIYTNIANVYSGLDQFDSACRYYQCAFDQIRPGFNESSVLRTSFNEFLGDEKIEFLPNLLRDKADAFIKHYRATGDDQLLGQAIKIYKVANQLLNRIKTEESMLLSKLVWRNSMQLINQHAIEACYASKDVEDAFYFFENSRAVLLNDQLSQQSKMDKKEILDLAQIKRQILELEKEISQVDATSAKYGELRTQLLKVRGQQIGFEDVLKRRNPLYYQTFEDTSLVTVKDVQQKLLSDHQALLEMFVGDSAVYSLLITPQEARLRRLGKKDYDTTTSQFVSYISNASLLNDRYDDFTRVGNHLYQLIFQGDPIPPGRIIISPDGRYFPFEALIESNQAPSPVYFVQDHAVSYSYSARYLMSSFSESTSGGGESFLGVAPVNYASSFSLAPLPESDRSLQEIGSYIGNTLNLVAAKASKTNFLQLYSNYKIIQLYTHSSENSSRGEPVIYFADSALYLSELIPEKIPLTRLVVLSACETGNGKSYQGEGVFSFNRGFASMGIPSSVINLWDVDNKTTYRLVELFYKYVSQELPIDVAMQKAKVEFIQTSSKEQGLPYYWAASIVAGKSDKVYSKKRNSWMMYAVAGAGFVGLCMLVWAGWRQRRSRILSAAG